MSHALQKLLEQKNLHSIQSWYDPALYLLNEMMEAARYNLRKRNYSETNAAIQRDIFREQLQRRYRIPMQMAMDIEKSMGRAGVIEFIGGNFVKPANKESQSGEVKP